MRKKMLIIAFSLVSILPAQEAVADIAPFPRPRPQPPRPPQPPQHGQQPDGDPEAGRQKDAPRSAQPGR